MKFHKVPITGYDIEVTTWDDGYQNYEERWPTLVNKWAKVADNLKGKISLSNINSSEDNPIEITSISEWKTCKISEEELEITTSLIGESCYICLEDCEIKSTCGCNTFVHQMCLQKLNNKNCTICKEPFSEEVQLTISSENEIKVPTTCWHQCTYKKAFYFITQVITVLIFSYVLGCAFVLLVYNDKKPSLWQLYGPQNILYGLGFIVVGLCFTPRILGQRWSYRR